MDLKTPLTELARWEPKTTPVVSVYLNTRWTDEQQRERVRIFLKNRLKDAHEAGAAAAGDLDWTEQQGRALIDRVAFEDVDGVALFACEGAGLRQILPVRIPFEDTFIVAATPFLRLLAEIADEAPDSLVVFIDGTSARLIPLNAAGPDDEVRLEGQVEGRHRAGGWAALAQSRYQRHIEEHREQHFEAVAAAVVHWSDRRGASRVVLAGEPRMVAALRRHLPERVAGRIVGTVAGTRHEPTRQLAARAAQVLAGAEEQRESEAVDAALAEAAKGGAAVAGLDATLDAVNRGAVRHLYVLEAFREPGVVCSACGALQRRFRFKCEFCGNQVRTISIREPDAGGAPAGRNRRRGAGGRRPGGPGPPGPSSCATSATTRG